MLYRLKLLSFIFTVAMCAYVVGCTQSPSSQQLSAETDSTAALAEVFLHPALGNFAPRDVRTTITAAATDTTSLTTQAVEFLRTQPDLLPYQGGEADSFSWAQLRIKTTAATATQSASADQVHHVTLQQTFANIPVFGGEVSVHFTQTQLLSVNGRILQRAPVMGVAPSITRDVAFRNAQRAASIPNAASGQAPKLYWVTPASLVEGKAQGVYLAYMITVNSQSALTEPAVVFIDAHNGKLLWKYRAHTHFAREVRDFNNKKENPTTCFTEGDDADSPALATDCKGAVDSAKAFYDYFNTEHGRQSYNGIDGALQVDVRYGTTINAFWDNETKRAVLSEGNATLDVVAHEFTHGMTYAESGLIYDGQPGALNESLSDIFAVMVDSDDWDIGDGSAFNVIRSFATPNTYAQPQTTNDRLFFCGNEDNQGVHTNSGVPNHTIYLIAQQLGRQLTAKVVYKAATEYLSSGSKFIQFAQALQSACGDLHGETSEQCVVVRQAIETTLLSANFDPCKYTKDSYEADDKREDAKPIRTDNVGQHHTFHEANDNDWVKFTGHRCFAYTVRTEPELGTSDELDTAMELYDSPGNKVLEDTDSTRFSTLAYQPQVDALVYVRIHEPEGRVAPSSIYQLRVTATPIAGDNCPPPPSVDPDAYEGDNTFDQAKDWTSPHDVRNFHQANDEDWIRVQLIASRAYRFTAVPDNNPHQSIHFELYDGGGASLLGSNDGQPGAEVLLERRVYEDQALLLRVRPAGEMGFAYRILVDSQEIQPASDPDEYEGDDSMNSAKMLSAGAEQFRSSHILEDEDWILLDTKLGSFSIVAEPIAGSPAKMRIDFFGGGNLGLVQLGRAEQDENGGARTTFELTRDVPIYARVKQRSINAYGQDYQYRVTFSEAQPAGDAYEPDDTYTQAHKLPLEEAQIHGFHLSTDRDWVALDVIPGSWYILETTVPSGSETMLVADLFRKEGESENLVVHPYRNREITPTAGSRVWFQALSAVVYASVAPLGGSFFLEPRTQLYSIRIKRNDVFLPLILSR